jgi:hypothetical protein
MKKLVLIGFIFLSGCKGAQWGLYDRNNYVKKSYWTKAQILEYRTMNPAVHTAINKIKSNGDKKFNQGYSSSRGIIL